MKERKTSRVLNDDSFFLGLSYNDITAIGILLLIVIIIFKTLGIENMFLVLCLSLSGLVILIPIRMTKRRKIIRDTFQYLFKNGVIYVSKNNRNQ